MAELEEITPAEAHLRQQAGAILVDVREPDEWAEGYAPNAELLQLNRILAGVKLPPIDRPLLLICRSGRRSATAQEVLIQRGYQQVANVAGGMLAWVKEGLPVVLPNTEGSPPA